MALTATPPPRPSRFKRPTLLIVGCGDIGRRVVRLVSGRWRVLALTRHPEEAAALRALGAEPLVGDLDRQETLGRLGPLADAVLHLAPPPGEGRSDPRTRNLVRALARAGRVRRLVYASTSGVYGDCAGARVDETRPIDPQTDRAWRRADAEGWVRTWGRAGRVHVTVLRVPGIYARDRPGGHPRERLERGTPVLVPEEDVYTNHIHADDLARACVAALHRGLPQRVVNVSDATELKMGDYFDIAADLEGLPRPPRVRRAEAGGRLSLATLSFLGESRRLDNRRLVRELRLRLRYPRVHEGLMAGAPSTVAASTPTDAAPAALTLA